MKSEVQLKQALLKQELAKIAKYNPTAIPLYIILNSLKPSDSQEQPLTLCKKGLSVKEFLQSIRKKYSNYPFIYFFGRERRSSELKGKNKQRGSGQAKQERQKFIVIDERIEMKNMEQIHQRYKDNNGLLVVVVSQAQLAKQKRKPMYESIFYILAIVFAAAFLFLTFSEEEVVVRRESELDFIV